MAEAEKVLTIAEELAAIRNTKDGEVSPIASDALVSDIIDNPSNYGLDAWSAWDASAYKDKDGNYFAGGKALVFREKFAVLPKVKDGQKFVRSFGWPALVEAYNGTSGRVDAQGVVRSMFVAAWYVDKGKSITLRAALIQVVRRTLLGEKAKGGGGGGQWYVDNMGNKFRTVEEVTNANKAHAERTRTFRGMDQVEYKTALEAKQASVAFLTASGVAPDVAIKLVANMPE
jgi:hypothetical protein